MDLLTFYQKGSLFMLQKMTVQSKGPRLATRVFHKTYFPLTIHQLRTTKKTVAAGVTTGRGKTEEATAE